MNRAVVGVGSNIDAEENIAQARILIAAQLVFLAESKFIETEPIGFSAQPNFLNGAFLVETPLSRTELSVWLKGVEEKLGRIRTENKYGPRTIDLDLLVWNGEIIDEHVFSRRFLQESIKEVWPEIVF